MGSEWEVTLHDGSRLDGRSAQAALRLLRSFSEEDPSLLQRLHDQLSKDKPTDSELITKYDEVFFTEGNWLNYSKLVFRNAIVRTFDGAFEIVEPFERTEDNRHVLETIEQNKPIILQRLARKHLNGDGGLTR
ncbi:MAG: hypothetical protein JNL67_16455 [Planctomycetaceae bacterium]|nr:hypothetical protein [Planctomycetaceae bacterium]